MKKGFTLVELLAVIAILGIIVLITIPIIRDTINTQRFNQFKLSVEGLINAVNEDTAIDNYALPRRYEYKTINQTKDLYLIKENDEIALQVSGNIRYNVQGKILINTDNELIVFVINDKFCAVKEPKDQEIYYGIYTDSIVDETGAVQTNRYITEGKIDLSDKISRLRDI